MPIITRTIVPLLRHSLTDPHIYVLLTTTVVVSMTLAFNLVMFWVYTAKIPFFEQYRCNPNVQPFPFRDPGLGKKTLRSGDKPSSKASS
jgi:hypothetical protein